MVAQSLIPGMEHRRHPEFAAEIVRKGIDRMGGQVGVDSAFGKGCRFWLRLKPSNAISAS